MITGMERNQPAPEQGVGSVPNGAALAALLAAGIGAFAVGLFVILSETGIYAAPSLYGPAGGVSGRTAFAAVAWLLAWGVLHRTWQARQLAPRPVYVASAALTAAGLLLTFPPFWGIL